MSKTGNKSVTLREEIILGTVKLSFAACTINKDKVKVNKDDIQCSRCDPVGDNVTWPRITFQKTH
jgi:hypothetical protein